jgi:hypothetical protein
LRVGVYGRAVARVCYRVEVIRERGGSGWGVGATNESLAGSLAVGYEIQGNLCQFGVSFMEISSDKCRKTDRLRCRCTCVKDKRWMKNTLQKFERVQNVLG